MVIRRGKALIGFYSLALRERNQEEGRWTTSASLQRIIGSSFKKARKKTGGLSASKGNLDQKGRWQPQVPFRHKRKERGEISIQH